MLCNAHKVIRRYADDEIDVLSRQQHLRRTVYLNWYNMGVVSDEITDVSRGIAHMSITLDTQGTPLLYTIGDTVQANHAM